MLPLVATEPMDGLGVSLFPNPMQDVLTITLTQGNGQVSFHDVNGLEVLKQEIEGGKTVLNVSGLAAGVYFIRYAGTTWKFIKL
jgi:hypothetical protein